MPDLVPIAADLVRRSLNGERASALLSERLAELKATAADAERLASLVYGALRRERRVRRVLGELGRDGPEGDVALVLGAALLDGQVGVSEAQQVLALEWQRFLELDRSVLSRAEQMERVALSGSLPDWLAARLLAQYGEEAAALAASLSEPAPRSLRVNALRCDVETALEQLGSEGATVARGRWARRALRLSGAFHAFATRAFHDGLFELQDEGSQLACELVAPPPRSLVVDACAGAGGKSLALAAQLEGRGRVLSLDVDQGKLVELRRRAKRAGAVNVRAVAIAPEGEWPPEVSAVQGKVERLLIDAPCSGTGVLRRNPEARARLHPDAVERLAQTQRAIVERCLPLLSPGGRLVFATCSLLREEGEALFDELEAAHPELQPLDLAAIYDRAYIDRFVRSAPHRVRLLPHLHGTDGFFVTCLRKRTRSSTTPASSSAPASPS